jgi:MoxR-like ATPase
MDVFMGSTTVSIIEFYPTNSALLSDRIRQLIVALSQNLQERDHTLKLTLLAILTGEHVFLFGPPGVAKSQLAKRLNGIFEKPTYFECLLHRFATPEELFGPLSISALKNEGRYERLIEGYLPNATVAFLDEIWKSSPAILNTLLTVLNERQFKNGHQWHACPLYCAIGASNEFPESDMGLNALYDRFLVRLKVSPIEKKRAFKALLKNPNHRWECPSNLKISAQEYQIWQHQHQQVTLDDDIFEKIYQLKNYLSQQHADISEKISDRRWKKAIELLKAAAFFNGREYIHSIDLLILKDCLWFDEASEATLSLYFKNWAITETFQQKDHIKEQEKIIQHYEQEWQMLYDHLSCPFQPFTRFNKTLFQCLSLFEQPNYELAYKKTWIKLLVLQPNHRVSEHDPQISRWLYVKPEDLSNLQHGETKVLGFLNQNPNLLSFKLELDAEHRLIVRDEEHRPIYLMLENTLKENKQYWAELFQYHQQFLAQLEELQEKMQFNQTDFHAHQHHHFIEQTNHLLIKSAFHDTLSNIANQIEEWQKHHSVLKNPLHYYQITMSHG